VGRIESDYYNFMDYDPVLTRKVLSYYVPMFAGRSPVLELGCGRGEFLELLTGAGIKASGIDNDEGMVELARASGVEVAVGDAVEALHVDPAPGPYGGIFCSHFLEHLPTESVQRVLEGVRRTLQPGGTFIAVVPNPACYSVLSRDFWRDPTHVRFYEPSLIAFLCTQAGLTVESIGENPQNHPGPPPENLPEQRTFVHPGLEDAIQEWLRLASNHSGIRLPGRGKAEWEQVGALSHLLSMLNERLTEIGEALRSFEHIYSKMLWTMYPSNDVYVVARG